VRVKRACEAAGQPLAVLEVTGRPVFLNSAWTTLLGQPDPKVPFDAQLAAPFADVAVRDALREVLAGRRRSFLGESDVASAQPNVRVLAAVDGVFTEGGLPAGAVVVLTDLRERIRSEEERRHMQARVERAERLEALALVTGTVAHDFNNLLTGILCETALLSEEISVETGPQRDAIEQIERTARRAADLCRQLLAYSGKGTFIVRRTDLGALARGVVDVLRPLVPKSVKVVVRATSPQVHAVVDAIQLRQVLMNLVVNACDASGDGRDGRGEVDVVVEPARLEEPTIFGSATEAAPAGSYVVVRVRDHGAGIPEAVRRRIFEPFFSTKRTGKGLGLATVLGIARSHHGVVEVESALGGGTCFSVWLPAAPAVVSEPRLPEALAAGAAGKRVLAVEDEAPALRVVRRILEREGYAVLTAETVASARSVLLDRDLEIDLVFTDLRLPDGSGREVIAASSARDPLLPVILTSGASDSEAPLSPTTPNLVAFLPKPYDRAQLLAAIAAALAGPR
jgi:signal transduction histidine kinase/ActR/RegA family two-component response regulator